MEGYRSGHNEAVLKTVWAQAHKGSNPFPSAKEKNHHIWWFFLFIFINILCKNLSGYKMGTKFLHAVKYGIDFFVI